MLQMYHFCEGIKMEVFKKNKKALFVKTEL